MFYVSFQFSSVIQSCPTLCNPMSCSTPGLPVQHQLPESTQIHIQQVGDAIQPSSVIPFSTCPQFFPASGSFQMSQVFAGGQSIGVSASASVLPTQTHVHRAGDAIRPSHPLSSPSPARNPSHHQGLCPVNKLFTSGCQSIRVSVSASVFPMNTQD